LAELLARRAARSWNCSNRRSKSDVRSGSDIVSSSHGGCVHRNVFEDLGNDLIGGDALGFGLEIEDQPVAQCQRRHGLDVIVADVELSLYERPDFGGQDQGLPAARACRDRCW